MGRALRHHHAAPVRRAGGERGVTLVEITVALAVSVLLISVIGNLLITSTHVAAKAQSSVESSTSAFRSSSRFADDVSAVGPVTGVTAPVQRGQTGCGSTTAAVRLIGPGQSAAVTIRSYDVTTSDGVPALRRRACHGASVAAATSATPAQSEIVVPDLGSASTAVQVTCNGDSPTAPFTDSNCTQVTLAITTKTGLRFTLTGGYATTLSPTPTTTVVPVRAPATGTCTIYATQTAWGATGGVAGSSSANHNGDGVLYTYNDTNQRNSFLLFDLTAPCGAAGDSWPKLPGGRLLTSVKLYLTYLGKSGDSCWIFPGISYDGQTIEALADGATWTEAGLTGSNMPSSTRGNAYTFNVGNQNNPTEHVNAVITDAVKQWYSAGGWKNRGFRLRRSSVGDTCGNSNRFASRFAGNANQRPRLVITWG